MTDPNGEALIGVNEILTDAVECCSYCLAKSLNRYDRRTSQSIVKLANCLQVEIEDPMFDATNPTLSLALLKDFKHACDAADIHRRSAIRLPSIS